MAISGGGVVKLGGGGVVKLGGGLGHDLVVSAVVDDHLAVDPRVTRRDDVVLACEMSDEVLVDADLDTAQAIIVAALAQERDDLPVLGCPPRDVLQALVGASRHVLILGVCRFGLPWPLRPFAGRAGVRLGRTQKVVPAGESRKR
jgi:hypothetical protein